MKETVTASHHQNGVASSYPATDKSGKHDSATAANRKPTVTEKIAKRGRPKKQTAESAQNTDAPNIAIPVYRVRDLGTTKTKRGLLPVSPATIWRWVREGKFPKPFKLGEGTTVWDEAEVNAFIARRAGDA